MQEESLTRELSFQRYNSVRLHFPGALAVYSSPQSFARSSACSNRKVGLSVALRKYQTIAMLGQAVRRFTTSAVRSSHYAEGPGKVISVVFRIFYLVVTCDVALSRPCS